MKAISGFLFVLVLAVSGCTSNSKSRLQEQQAFIAGQQQAFNQQQQAQANTVMVRGEVRNQSIPWTQELTLAGAILASKWKGFMAPREILVIRRGQSYPINLDQFLRGLDDPALEPGDIVDLRR